MKLILPYKYIGPVEKSALKHTRKEVFENLSKELLKNTKIVLFKCKLTFKYVYFTILNANWTSDMQSLKTELEYSIQR